MSPRRPLLFLIFVGLISTTLADCPHKGLKSAPPAAPPDSQPPSSEPPDHFVQTTFIYRDLNDEDREYSIMVSEVLRQLRPRLLQLAKLTVENENVDCGQHGFTKCAEFPPHSAFHFLIVEDATHGAVVYSIDRAPNGPNPDRIEMAVLDALSRHSSHSLMSYATETSKPVVGFIRELSVRELEGFVAAQQQLRDAAEPTLFTRSPFELRLLNEWILELRDAKEDTTEIEGLNVSWEEGTLVTYIASEIKDCTAKAKTTFRAGQLSPLIDLDDQRPVFVLFYTNVNSVSVHVHTVWRRAVAALRSTIGDSSAIFGVVPCHQEVDFCAAFGIQQADHRTVFAYRQSRRFASQFAVGDDEHYINWVRMVLYGSPHKLESDEELQNARRGILKTFNDEIRPAVTVGVFGDETDEDFLRFKKLGQMLNGRYHFAYRVQKGAAAAVSTFRPLERTKRIDYTGPFDVKSLIAHVTQSTVPSVLNISTGFTGDIIYRAGRPVILLIHNNDAALLTQLAELAVTNKKTSFFAHIDTSYSFPIGSFLTEVGMNDEKTAANEVLPVLCQLNTDDIRCVALKDEVSNALASLQSETPSADVKATQLDRSKAHPLKALQMAHVNRVFGFQDVRLLPDPVIARTFNHGVHNLDEGAAGGCPMMAHMGGAGAHGGHGGYGGHGHYGTADKSDEPTEHSKENHDEL